MKKIYTKNGDGGMTNLRGGVKVPKDDIRIETNGTLDELNAAIGIIRALLQGEESTQRILEEIQQEIMVIMSHIATPEGRVNPKILNAAGLTLRIEAEMDRILAEAPAPKGFLLPGGTLLAAQFHMARTIARRAERRLWTLHRKYPLDGDILRFMNRLSDLLFVMAHAETGMDNPPG